MRITRQGMVPIPPEIQDQLGLVPDTEVQLVVEGNALRITKTPAPETRGSEVLRRLRGSAATTLSTDEIMAMTRGDE
jgi:antitoxin component of MazEF toxin-antitoxin module